MRYFDAAARGQFKLSHSNDIGLDAHVIDEQINEMVDNLEDNSPQEYCITKKDLLNVDLSSFKPQMELNPKVWVNNSMNSRVRLRLLDIADDFIDTLKVDWVKPKDIILTGSLANYNWSQYSDFDLHIILDFNKVDNRVEFVKDYFDTKKNEWNNSHENLTIYGFPVEIYVQDINELHTASGIYSLEKNKWLKIPEKNSIKAIKLDKFFIKEKAIKFMRIINSLQHEVENEIDEQHLSEVSKKVKRVFDKIKGIRKTSLKKAGENSPGNIIYKVLRRNGYISTLLELKAKTYDKLKSIEK